MTLKKIGGNLHKYFIIPIIKMKILISKWVGRTWFGQPKFLLE